MEAARWQSAGKRLGDVHRLAPAALLDLRAATGPVGEVIADAAHDADPVRNSSAEDVNRTDWTGLLRRRIRPERQSAVCGRMPGRRLPLSPGGLEKGANILRSRTA